NANEQTYSKTLTVEDNHFDGFFGEGTVRLRLSGRIDGDQIKVTGQVLDLALIAAQVAPGSFSSRGPFKDGGFSLNFTTHPSSIRWGSSAHDRVTYTGTVEVTDPDRQAAAAAQAKPAQSAAAVPSTTQAVVPPPQAALQPVSRTAFDVPTRLTVRG